MNTVIYIGLDVDDNAFHGFAISSDKKEGFPLKSKPKVTDLLKKLEAISKDPAVFHLCYEAGYLGFTLARELRAKGYKCDVIAPHLIPKKGNSAVKTDRIDAKNLSLMLSKGLLAACDIPDADTESVRALVRSRTFLNHRIRNLKNHIVSLCRKSGFHFKEETSSKAYWTVRHRTWIASLIATGNINPL
jgi:transposase